MTTTLSPNLTEPDIDPPEPSAGYEIRTASTGQKVNYLNSVAARIIFTLTFVVAIGLVVAYAWYESAAYAGIFDPPNLVAFIALTFNGALSAWFSFRVPGNLYLTISILFFFAAFLSLPAVAAVLVALITSLIIELFALRRGLFYSFRTAGMYMMCTLAGCVIVDELLGKPMTGDISLLGAAVCVLAFLAFRILNELNIAITQALQGMGFWGERRHLLIVWTINLLFMPAAMVLSSIKWNVGSVAFTFGCVMVSITGFLLKRVSSTREEESTQLVLVRDLNARLARQNEQQTTLASRINYALDSFLGLLNEYESTTGEQQSAFIEITATIEELSRTATQIATSADNVSGAAELAMGAVKSGQQTLDTTLEAINEVRSKVREIDTKIKDLDIKSTRIDEIASVINNIAGEIRLLALNATIEASGAGQFGRRFAIVANEVNQLADRSREALQQIRQIISEIQIATDSTRRTTEEGIKRMERSTAMAVNSEVANQEIMTEVEKTARAASAISMATQQQRAASEQVVASVHNVALMIGENARKFATVGQVSRELQEIVTKLRAENRAGLLQEGSNTDDLITNQKV